MRISMRNRNATPSPVMVAAVLAAASVLPTLILGDTATETVVVKAGEPVAGLGVLVAGDTLALLAAGCEVDAVGVPAVTLHVWQIVPPQPATAPEPSNLVMKISLPPTAT